MPSSSCVHAVYLSERDCGAAKAGLYWAALQSLQTNTQHEKWKRGLKDIKWHINQDKQEQNSATTITPHAPLGVQEEPGPPLDALLLRWLSLTVKAGGRNTGAVYSSAQSQMLHLHTGSTLVGYPRVWYDGRHSFLQPREKKSHTVVLTNFILKKPSKCVFFNLKKTQQNKNTPHLSLTSTVYIQMSLLPWDVCIVYICI